MVYSPKRIGPARFQLKTWEDKVLRSHICKTEFQDKLGIMKGQKDPETGFFVPPS